MCINWRGKPKAAEPQPRFPCRLWKEPGPALTCAPAGVAHLSQPSVQGGRVPGRGRGDGARFELNSPKQPSAPWEINNEYIFRVTVTGKSQF